MKKRILSLALALALCLGLAPLTALAAEQTVVYAHDEAELKRALWQSNVKIVLDGKDYRQNGEWHISDQENITLQGTTGTRLLVDSRDEPVIYIFDCKNITLENITAGHTDAKEDEIFKERRYEDGCGHHNADVIHIAGYNGDITIRNCDLYGCGYTGIEGSSWDKENLNVYDTIIHDCSHDALEYVSGNFYNCRFLRNGRDQLGDANYGASCVLGDDRPIRFYNCEFTDNYNSVFTNLRTQQIYMENCTFQNNLWTINGPKLQGYESTQEVEVDGEKVTFYMCAIKDFAGNTTNYVKIRDVALTLNGTPAQFNVGYFGCVNVATKQSYVADGSEGRRTFKWPYFGEVKASQTPTNVDNVMMDLDAVVYTDKDGGGHTFYQLRDLGQALGFNVGWSAERGVYIETGKPYDPSN